MYYGVSAVVIRYLISLSSDSTERSLGEFFAFSAEQRILSQIGSKTKQNEVALVSLLLAMTMKRHIGA